MNTTSALTRFAHGPDHIVHDMDNAEGCALGENYVYKPGPIGGYIPCPICAPGLKVPPPIHSMVNVQPPVSTPRPYNAMQNVRDVSMQREPIAPPTSTGEAIYTTPLPTHHNIMGMVRELADSEGKSAREVLADLMEAEYELSRSDPLTYVEPVTLSSPSESLIDDGGDDDDGDRGEPERRMARTAGRATAAEESLRDASIQPRNADSVEGPQPGVRGRSDATSRRRTIANTDDHPDSGAESGEPGA